MQRYLNSDLTLTEVGEQFGTGRYNLAAWLKQAEILDEVSKKQPVKSAPVPTDERSAADKLRVPIEAGRLSSEELGEFLRREGLRDGDLERFRAGSLRRVWLSASSIATGSAASPPKGTTSRANTSRTSRCEC